MAKKWCGFLPQNESVRSKWHTLVGMQDDSTKVVDLEVSEPEPEDSDPEQVIPIPRQDQ